MQKNTGSEPGSIDLFRVSRGEWIGFGLVFAILWGIALYLWCQSNTDMAALSALNYKNFGAALETPARACSRYGMSVIALVYLCYLLISFRGDDLAGGNQVFLLVIFSFAVAGITGDLVKELLHRSRPALEFAGELTGAKGSDSPAFPSGHATKSVALVLPFLFFAAHRGSIHSVLKVILAVIALLVCLSRIVLGRHYTSDVLAGIGWAFLCLPAAVLLTNVILRRMKDRDLVSTTKKWVFIYIGLVILLFMI